MMIPGVGGFSGLGSSLFQSMTRATAGAPLPRSSDFATLSIGSDPLAPDTGAYAPPLMAGFEDRTVTTTIDDIVLKVDVSRVVKGAADSTSTSGDSATETLRIRVETTADPITGQQTRRVVDPAVSSAGALDSKTVNALAEELANGQGALQGVVSIQDHRTIAHTYYKTVLTRGDDGKLVAEHRISSDSRSLDLADEAKSTVGFDASEASRLTPETIARALAGEYSSQTYLAMHIPGLAIEASA